MGSQSRFRGALREDRDGCPKWLKWPFILRPLWLLREITAEGRRITKLDQILLNGNNIAILVPGGSPDPE
ncbi:hypothetical protein J5N97_017581 [Dioscorea zingiberensis]|uniref:LSM domain-containing protein n=1 Tax=Dioscorea zingiberensis TaxID=325984 RepID=A0A9D5HGC2_9LILI|nr:hypothetical protein J5N97_017581 [Dioscorea zingiberensis]